MCPVIRQGSEVFLDQGRFRALKGAVHVVSGLVPVGVDAYNGFPAVFHFVLKRHSGFADHALHETSFHGAEHTARLVDLLDHGLDALFHLMGKRFDVVGAAQRIDHVGEMRFFLQDILGIDSDARGAFRGHAQHLVEGVRVQGLQTAEHPGHSLNRDACDVIERLLAREVDPRSLGMELEAPGFGIPDTKTFPHDALPDLPTGPKLGDLLEKTDGNVEEKRKPLQELLRVQPAGNAILRVLNCCGQGESHRLGRRGAGLLHVLTHHRQWIPVRHVLLGKRDVVHQNPSRAG
ncbi:MAG: hypothetical protein MAG794_01162 [Gammaproteobacteria bacterium]|nr:hypothetical protein [Gammaproteobacteria bacterium]